METKACSAIDPIESEEDRQKVGVIAGSKRVNV